MRDSIARTLGVVFAVGYFTAIVWIYTRQPQTVAEATGALSASIGLYAVDRQAYADGLNFFHTDRFAAARLAFGRADPANQDPNTQFYIAYSYYREGWGRVYVDKDLYARGLESINRAIAAAPQRRVAVDDPDLLMHTADELKAELESALQSGAYLNPFSFARRKRK